MPTWPAGNSNHLNRLKVQFKIFIINMAGACWLTGRLAGGLAGLFAWVITYCLIAYINGLLLVGEQAGWLASLLATWVGGWMDAWLDGMQAG